MENTKIELLPHQKKTVKKVINEFNGRAILADEVGMGKTIEAGMILREYIKMGEINKLLILVPASLGFQWVEEMVKKIKIENIFFNRKGVIWDYFDYQIASIDMAKRKKHASELRKIDFDMVIVDEAHKLKNSDTLNWKFVNSLKKKYCLLLTATPVQNNLKELYNLIRILYPDKYKDYKDFKKKYVGGKYLIKNKNELKDELSDLMIRNYHTQIKNEIGQRNIKQYFVTLTEEERILYDRVTDYVKKQFAKNINRKKSILHLLTYQREMCSSSYALQRTLAKKNDCDHELKEIYELANNIKYNKKLEKVFEILKKYPNEKILIFTEFRATQAYIAYHLEKSGYKTIVYNGGMSSSSKEWIKNIFKKQRDIMISTEAGSQGLNLQFSNVIINYDLPWNPMKLEQRIGRVDRLGQNKDVFVYNLATKDTIEEKILYVLYKKINLLKDIVGDMEDILKTDNKNLDSEIIDILCEKNLKNTKSI